MLPQLCSRHIDHRHLVRIRQHFRQRLRPEFAFRHIRLQVAAVPQGYDVIRVRVDRIVARRHVVFFKVFVDLSGGREPPQCVRPQVSQVGFTLPRRVLPAGQREGSIGLQGIVQFDHVSVSVGKGGGESTAHRPGHHRQDHQNTQDLLHGFHLQTRSFFVFVLPALRYDKRRLRPPGGSPAPVWPPSCREKNHHRLPARL